MTRDEKQAWRDRIDRMTHMEMAIMQRCLPTSCPTHPIFDGRNHKLYQYFQARFKAFGGMAPEVVEVLGW